MSPRRLRVQKLRYNAVTYRRAAALAASLSLFAATQAAAGLDEDPFLGELPVVLSASRLSQPLREAPGAVTVIDRDMIRASGVRSLADLLRWVPGFQVGTRKGHSPLTTYHGLSDDAPRRMLVRIDGRSAYSPYFISGIEWHKIGIDLEDIERIEVFRGTNAAAYGSQAFMGVVNIVTRAAADTPRLRVRANQGDNGIQDRSATIGAQLGAAALRLTVGTETDDGLAHVYDSHRRHRADLRADVQVAPEHRLEVHGGAVRLDAGTGIPRSSTNPERDLRSETSFGQLRWRWQPAPGDEVSLTYFHYVERAEDHFIVTRAQDRRIPPGGLVVFDYSNRVTRDDIELEHTLTPTATTRLVWGLGHRQDRLRAPRTFARNDELSYHSARLFGNLEWRASPKWLFNGGVMAEKGSYSGVLLAPRIAANYHLAPSHTLRASVSRANRRPTPFERHADVRYYVDNFPGSRPLSHAFQPSPDVEAEHITVRELGYLGEIPTWSLSADLRVFEERATRLTRPDGRPSQLNPVLSPSANQFVNDLGATIHGAEMTLMWRPQRQSWLGVNYTRLAVEGESTEPNLFRRDKLDERIELSAPRVSASVFAAWAPSAAWHLSASRHYVGAMRWETTGVRGDAQVAPYYRTDWRIARRFAAGDARGELALVVSNGGDRHADFIPGQNTPRQAYASLGVEF